MCLLQKLYFNFNAMKILLAVCIFFVINQPATGQIQVYKSGEMLSEGYFVDLTHKLIHIRAAENGRLKLRSFFLTALDSIVIRDSTAFQDIERYLDNLALPYIVSIDKPDWTADLEASLNIIDPATKSLLVRNDTMPTTNIKLAGQQLEAAGNSMILGTLVTIVGGFVPIMVSSSSPELTNSGIIVGGAFSIAGLIITIDGYNKLRKAGRILMY